MSANADADHSLTIPIETPTKMRGARQHRYDLLTGERRRRRHNGIARCFIRCDNAWRVHLSPTRPPPVLHLSLTCPPPVLHSFPTCPVLRSSPTCPPRVSHLFPCPPIVLRMGRSSNSSQRNQRDGMQADKTGLTASLWVRLCRRVHLSSAWELLDLFDYFLLGAYFFIRLGLTDEINTVTHRPPQKLRGVDRPSMCPAVHSRTAVYTGRTLSEHSRLVLNTG